MVLCDVTKSCFLKASISYVQKNENALRKLSCHFGDYSEEQMK